MSSSKVRRAGERRRALGVFLRCGRAAQREVLGGALLAAAAVLAPRGIAALTRVTRL